MDSVIQDRSQQEPAALRMYWLCQQQIFLLLFGKIEYYGYFGATFEQSTFLYGLGLMILGPLVLRVTYEFVMMAILLVQNVIAINRKLKVQATPVSPAPAAKAEEAAEPAAAESASEE